MKKIRLSVFDEFGNICFEFGESPLWRHGRKLTWVEVVKELRLKDSLVTRLKDWKLEGIATNKHQREDRVKCEIEGLTILLELRKELHDYEITYSSNFNSYSCVLNKEKVDDY